MGFLGRSSSLWTSVPQNRLSARGGDEGWYMKPPILNVLRGFTGAWLAPVDPCQRTRAALAAFRAQVAPSWHPCWASRQSYLPLTLPLCLHHSRLRARMCPQNRNPPALCSASQRRGHFQVRWRGTNRCEEVAAAEGTDPQLPACSCGRPGRCTHEWREDGRVRDRHGTGVFGPARRTAVKTRGLAWLLLEGFLGCAYERSKPWLLA
jgi:hypothetical protein